MAACLSAMAMPLWAQQRGMADSMHTVRLSNIEVIGKIKKERGVTFYDAARLADMQGRTLGETLSRIAGIQNLSFGPNTGLPMIRSLSGHRVRILADGMTLNDMAGITPGVNIDIDQDKLKGVEVFKGSAAVLYGGKAIGGAINLKNELIPTRSTDGKLGAKAQTDYGFNSGLRSSFSLTANLGKRLAWHLGAMYHYNSAVSIPGNTKPDMVYDGKVIGFDTPLQKMAQIYVESEHRPNYTIFPYKYPFSKEYIKEMELSEGDLYTFSPKRYENGRYVPNPPNPIYVPGQDKDKDRYVDVVTKIEDYGPVKKGRIPNSHAMGNSVEGGLSYASQHLTIGAGYQHTHAYYGIPGYALSEVVSSSHTHADGYVHHVQNIEFAPINTRSDIHLAKIQAEVADLVPCIPYIKWRAQWQHSADEELLGSKQANKLAATRYSARLELHQTNLGFLNGMTGIDYDRRTISSHGTQRYLPNNRSRETGFFTSQHFEYKFLHAGLGYRHDIVDREATPDATYKPGRGLAGGKLSKRHYNLNQFNLMARTDFGHTGYLMASFSHSERAPEVNELYAGNTHFAIVTEENGDDRLGCETANTFEIGGGIDWKGFSLSANYYNTAFNRYLYLAHTGISRGWYAVKEWRAADTRICGIETRLSYTLALRHIGRWEASGYYDLVKNKDSSGDHYRNALEGAYMPNMPTSRFGFALSGSLKAFAVNIDLDRYLKQKYLGKNINPEHAFPPYTLLGARIGYTLRLKPCTTEFYLYGKNLLNQEARPQNSLLRYLAPLPGINIGGGLKLSL